MMEKISRDESNFEDVKKEYRDYYTDFTSKYGFTPTEYSFLLFGELTIYYSDISGLVYAPTWRDIKNVYGQMSNKALIGKVIDILSGTVDIYSEWASETENHEWDFSKFFEYPFIVDNNGKYISVSDITLRNAFFEKIFWLIRDCYPQNDSRAMAFFGRLFEKYIQDITQDAVKCEYKYIDEFIYKQGRNEKKSSDAYVRNGENLLIVEAKGFSVLLDCMTKNERVDKNNKKLFVDPVLQADACLAIVENSKSEFSGVENAYIIAVTMDNINAVPDYYNQIHAEVKQKKICNKTKFFFNFSIEEYEMLMYLLEQNEDIFSLLEKYYESDRLKPFSNYLHEIFPDISMTTFMEQIYHEASDKMKELLFKDSE